MSGTATGWKRAPIALALLFALALVEGCATSGRAQDEPQTAEQVAQSRFRARWWNYYDRAIAYQVLGEWTQAEADLRSAISKRSRDQRWARTYGLHFEPEYFPKRELGFVLYKLERYEEAIDLLERSMNEQPTARAAYYIDECRSVLVQQSGEDRDPPQIALISPDPANPIAALALTGEVQLADDTFIRRAWIDDEHVREITVSSAGPITIPFSKPARPGINEVNVRAEDITGRQSSMTFRFSTDLDGPAVSFDEPLVVPGRVSGEVYDASGVAAFTVAGRPVPLSNAGGGVQTFELEVDDSNLAGPALFRAEDTLGNATQDVLPSAEVARAAIAVQVASASSEFSPLGPIRLAATSDGSPRIILPNLENGLTTTSDQLSVHMDIRADAPVVALQLNDMAVDNIVPNRPYQKLTRRIQLNLGNNEVIVTVTDAEGRTVSTSTNVIREATVVDAPNNKLALAIIGARWDGVGTTDLISPDGIVTALEREVKLPRYQNGAESTARFEVVDRQNLDDILLEQELSTIIDEVANRVQSGQIVAADLIVRGDVTVVDGHLGVTLTVVDSETSISDFVDAFLPLDDDGSVSVTMVAEHLALLLEQLYPRVAGKIAQIAADGTKAFSEEITSQDGVRPRAKCLVYRRDAYQTSQGQTFFDYTIVAPGGELSAVTPIISTVIPDTAIAMEASDASELYVITK